MTAYTRGEGTYDEIARRFVVSPASVSRYLRRHREKGSLAPKPATGGQPRRLDEAGEEVLRALVAEQPDAFCRELADRLLERAGVKLDEDTVGKALRRLGLTRKKKTLKAAEQTRPDVVAKRDDFVGQAAKIEPGRAHFIDEAGTHVAMTRDFGRAPRGERVVDHVPRNRGAVTTMIGSLCLDGIETLRTFVGGTTGDRFVAFVAEDLVPRLRTGDVVVWDGLAAHRDRRVAALVAAAGATIVVLPPYSPDMNPIEQAWSKLKTRLRAVGARSKEALEAALGPALATITAQDARGWFRLAGYPAAD